MLRAVELILFITALDCLQNALTVRSVLGRGKRIWRNVSLRVQVQLQVGGARLQPKIGDCAL